MRCGLTRRKIRLVGVDELGLRAIGHDGLAVETDAGQDGVDRLRADAALDRRGAHLAKKASNRGRLLVGCVRVRLPARTRHGRDAIAEPT